MEYSALKLPDLTVSCDAIFSRPADYSPHLAAILLSEFEQTRSPFFSGFEPPMIAVRPKQEEYLDLAVHLLTAYEKDGRGRWRHDGQRKVLEKAIRLLEKASGLPADDGDRDVALERGKAFLYRSRIIKPKELTVPGKKIEALEKAMKELSESEAEEARHYRGLAALELDRCGERPGDLESILEKATAGIDPRNLDPDQKTFEFFRMRIRLEELKGGDYQAPALLAVFSFNSRELALEALKVAIQTPGDAPRPLPECRENLLSSMGDQRFSHPVWEDAVRFLWRINRTVRLKDRPKPAPEILARMEEFLKTFPIDLWRAAEQISRELSDIHLRWYWSRQRDLYDLAFLSAVKQKNYALAAQIADSAKSRPALTWQALEQMSSADETLKEVIEQYAKVLGGGYVVGMKDYAPPAGAPSRPAEFPQSAAAGHRIVQFYLVHLRDFKEGYALICDETGWTGCNSFDFQPIWQCYLQWQTDYFSIPSGKRHLSAPLLKNLCEKMGEQLGFLFDFPQGTDILFIPHDFLHRVPLHGAINTHKSKDLEDHQILLENVRCAYWPSLAHHGNRETRLNDAWIALECFEKKDKNYSDKFQEIKDLFNDYCSGASPDDFKAACKGAHSLIAFFCHGKANVVNPFLSRLKLREPLTLLNISTMQEGLTGASIFLGACETDLMPSSDAPLDEHLSPATAFINKEASAVVGAMWEALPEEVIELLKDMREKGVDAIFELQRNLWDDYLHEEDADYLHYGLVFKLYHSTIGC